MALKIIGFIFVISFGYSTQNPHLDRDLPFVVNEVIHQITPRNPQLSKNQTQISSCPTGEFLIDTNIIYVYAFGCQDFPCIAFDGINYLVVWKDDRYSNTDSDIYAARVNREGIILDPIGIAISTAAFDQCFPSVTFDGTNYLIVWQDYRNNPDTADIYGARVNTDGIVIDSNSIAISTAHKNQEEPSVAFDGINYFVVWQDNRSDDYDIYGARISQTGVVLDPQGIAISINNNDQKLPYISFDGTNYLAVWDDRRLGSSDIFGARINRYGIVIDSNGIAVSTAIGDQENPSVTFDGTNYFTVWEDKRNSSESDIYGARISIGGTVIDSNGIVISTTRFVQDYPSVAFDGINYLVVWLEGGRIMGSRVSRNGVIIDSINISESNLIFVYEHCNTSIAFDGTNYFVAWAAMHYILADFADIYGTRVNRDGVVLDSSGIDISLEVKEQLCPAVAFDGENYLVVWMDGDPFESNIFGTRVSSDGIILDSLPIIISSRYDQNNPSVAFDGTNFLVVWTGHVSRCSIFGARVNRAGIPLDTNGFPISSALHCMISSSVAFDGINYVVVWEEDRNGSRDIFGTRIYPDGTVIDPNGFPISTAVNDQNNPSIVFGGINYLVVWQDARNGLDDIYGARISPNGQILDTSGITISTADELQKDPSVAFDGTNYQVVWSDYRNGSSSDIYGAQVNQAGIVLDPAGFAISTAVGDQLYPSVAFDGTNYLVIWVGHRSGSSYNIYGARVNQNGIVIDSFPVTTQTGNQYSLHLAHGSGNQVLITYSGWTDFINLHPANTYRIWGKFYPFAGIDEKNSRVKMQSAKLLEVYPNPARSFLAVRLPFSADRQTLKVFDVAGKMIKEIETLRSAQNFRERKGYNYDEAKISLKGINPGIYFLRVGKETKKFIVAK